MKKVRDSYENYEFADIYHAVNNFCTLDLSSFYMDFAKDVLYIEAENNESEEQCKRLCTKSSVTLTKLLSPILPHTADEVWSHIPFS